MCEQELTRAIEQRGAAKPSLWSCHFLALVHHQLGQKDQARAWFAKAVLPKDAPWDEAMIDRYLRREVEAELAEQNTPGKIPWTGRSEDARP